MIVKAIEMQNLRSYRGASVEFPLGKTLFEGDIGSGKSTILMAIEFAFFGLGSEAGSALLRLGESEGKVRMIFDVDGKEYEILRGLSRKGTRVQQTEGYLKTPEAKLHLSPTELKEKILDVLQFNEVPDPKAQSWIYRYAVYTPQEEMKSILLLTPDLRLQILRRAFGIEDYKMAGENANELAKEIRRKAENLEGRAADFDDLKSRIKRWKEQREFFTEELKRTQKVESENLAQLENLKKEREKLHDEEVRLSALINAIVSDEEFIKARGRDASEWMQEAEELEKRTAKLRQKIAELEQTRSPTARTMNEISADLRELEAKSDKLRRFEAKIASKVDEYHSIMENGVCPVCDRPAEAHEFVALEKAKKEEMTHVSEELRACVSKLEHAREELEKKREYETIQEKVVSLRDELTRNLDEIEKSGGRVARARGEIEKTKERLSTAKKQRESLADLGENLEELEQKIRRAETQLKDVRDKVTEAKTRMDDLTQQIAEGDEEAKQKERYGKRADTLRENEIWLQDYFEPTVEAIERNVMISINQDFNANFQKWFAMLIADPQKEVQVDENFTAIISQDGYEQEVNFLSGGERTSVALAYRLALNTLVQRVSTGMKSNLLILDEPTDGFSQEQLGNVREVLDDVACPQMIIVSHEKELESFADQIFRISKERGESLITSEAR